MPNTCGFDKAYWKCIPILYEVGQGTLGSNYRQVSVITAIQGAVFFGFENDIHKNSQDAIKARNLTKQKGEKIVDFSYPIYSFQ